jgi:hypothetical protein
VKNPPSAYLLKLKSYLDQGGVSRKVLYQYSPVRGPVWAMALLRYFQKHNLLKYSFFAKAMFKKTLVSSIAKLPLVLFTIHHQTFLHNDNDLVMRVMTVQEAGPRVHTGLKRAGDFPEDQSYRVRPAPYPTFLLSSALHLLILTQATFN